MASSTDEGDHVDEAISYNPVVRLNSLYRSFLQSNGQRIHQVESSVRNLTWFLPSQGLSVESMYTFLNLLSLYHDALLANSVKPKNASGKSSSSSTTRTGLALPVSPHSRYTRFWLRESKLYKTVARLLSIISYSQLLLEMAAKKYKGEKGRWRIVIGLESIKAVLRLVLLRLTAQRTVLQPSIPEREIDPSILAQAEAKNPSVSSDPQTWTGARTGFELPTIASLRAQAGDGVTRVESEISAFLQKKVLTIDGVRKPYDLVRKRKGVGVIAEVVWILRPLIYVLALKKYGKKHLYPFLVSLALEYFAYQNMAESLHSSSRRGAPTEVEKQELSKRRKAFWAYFLRGPVWYGWTRERLESITNKCQGVFGIGLVANILNDYKHLIDDYHYYSSS